MARSIVAVIAGFLAQSLASVSFHYALQPISPDFYFEAMYDPGMLVLSMGINLISAMVGGYVVAFIAASDEIRHALYLCALVAAISIFTFFIGPAFLPIWLQIVSLIVTLAGIYLGARIKTGRTGGGSSESLAFHRGMFMQTSNSNVVYGGIPMDTKSSETTRYLASSAIALGGMYRRQILDFLDDKVKAHGPELGYDLRFVAQLCRYFESRETRFQIFYIALTIVFFIIAASIAASSPYGADEQIIGLLFLFLVIAWIVRFKKALNENKWLVRFFKKSDFKPDDLAQKFHAGLSHDQVSTINENDGNLVIYNRFNPFIGAGIDIGGWSFAIDLTKPKEDAGKGIKVKDFALENLYEKIDTSLESLKFKGLKTQNTLYINGSDIREERWILPDIYKRPIKHAPDEKVEIFQDGNDSRIRFYKWIQTFDWGNEMVVSYFLRCAKRGKNLFVELSVFLLTPLDIKYKKVDSAVATDFRTFFEKGVQTLILTPFSIIASWFAILFKFFQFWTDLFNTKYRNLKREIKSNPLFNYGADQTLRELFSSKKYVHYFQLLDKEMYTKIIERELLDSFVNFLDAHNIDTSELKERQTSIINSGIIVQGGDVKAGAMAVGTGAKAEQKLPPLPRRKASQNK